MKPRLSLLISVFVGIVVLAPATGRQATATRFNSSRLPSQIQARALPSDPAGEVGVSQGAGRVMFIENVGQFDEEARFKVHGGDKTIWLADDAIWITLLEPAGRMDIEDHRLPAPEDSPFTDDADSEGSHRRGVNLRLSFIGANPEPEIQTYSPLTTTISYFIGADPEQWRPSVPVWGGVRYVDLYPGLDLELDAPGLSEGPRLVCRVPDCRTALSQVELSVGGADGMTLAGDEVRIETAIGEFSLPLFTVRDSGGRALSLEGVLPAISGNTITMPIFDAMQVSDIPTVGFPSEQADNPEDLLYSTFLGGGGVDASGSPALDAAGNVNVTGYTHSTNFPTTPGVFDTGHNSYEDAFVARLNAAGNALHYSTFLGGASQDFGNSLALDAAGNATLTGWTNSSGFPTTPGAYDTSHNGDLDAFVTRLNATGSALLYSTFLGGSSSDFSEDLDLDAAGNATVTGYTVSSNFPTTPGTVDTSHNGGKDAFVTRLSANGSALLYSTYLGGSAEEFAYFVALDAAGNATVTGGTWSDDFPTTSGAYDTSHNGGWLDAFVTGLNANGSALLYSTFLGGSSSDFSKDLALDAAGNATVTGYTDSTNFPTTPGAFDTSHNGGKDAFVTRLSANGSALLYSTFLGGSAEEGAYGIALDAADNVTVSGYTDSTNFPTTPGAYDTSHNGGEDAFVVRLNANSSALLYSTFLGGSSFDFIEDLTLDGDGNATVAGSTDSTDFPTTPGAFDRSYNGGDFDAFVAKLALDEGDFLPVPDGYSFCNGPTDRSCDTGWRHYPNPPANSDFTIEDMRDMFGARAVCLLSIGPCIPRPTALLWYQLVNYAMNGGHCLGMAVTSQRRYQDPNLIHTTYGLTLSEARRPIAYDFVKQFALPTLAFTALQGFTSTPAATFQDLEDSLSIDEHPTLGLISRDGRRGHAVTPYAIDDLGNGIWHVRVSLVSGKKGLPRRGRTS